MTKRDTTGIVSDRSAALSVRGRTRDSWLGRVDYVRSWQAMRRFSQRRRAARSDRIWLLEHDPVYTAGLSCRDAPARIQGIPVVRSDRGGRMSYHGPGQLMVYPLIDLARAGLTVRSYVRLLEQAVIDMSSDHGLPACRQSTRPGVFIDGAKVAFIGVRVTQGRAYHGLAVNVAVDIRPFRHIDPCGFPDLSITTLRRLGVSLSARQVGEAVAGHLNGLLASGAPTVPGRVIRDVPMTTEEKVFA